MAMALPTGTSGRSLALGMTLLVAAIVWVGVIAPIQDWYGERAEQLRRDQAMARRMTALVGMLPALRSEAERVAGAGMGGQDTDAPTALLAGTTDALAAASLQQQIDGHAATAGARIGSEEILPGQPAGDLRAIAVRLTITAPYRSLVALLLALARSTAPMVVDELQIHGSASTAGAADVPVEASLTVTSWRAAKPPAR
jgi:general secretion pathway protein M